ncbi:MAG: hypothetical protein PHR25_02155 [Clostridia bacterium]|nr:hypothetical protein [Clostridia bacterium]
MNNEIEQNSNENSNSIIDDKKLNMIIQKIIKLERENVKTNDLNLNEMRKEIRKIIEEEVNQCY